MPNEQDLLNLFNQVLYSSLVTSILLVFILLIKKIYMQIRERIKNIADFKQKSRIRTVVGIVMILLLTGAFMTDARGGLYSKQDADGQLPVDGQGISLGIHADPAKVTAIALEKNELVKKVKGREDMAKILEWISGTKCEQERSIDEFINKEWDGKVLIYEGEEIKDILTLKGNQLRWNSKWYNSNGYLWANLEKWYQGFAYPESEYQPLNDQALSPEKTLSLRTPEGRYIPNPNLSFPLFDPVAEKKIGQYSQAGDGKQDKIYDIYTIVNVPKEKAVLFKDEQGNKLELLPICE